MELELFVVGVLVFSCFVSLLNQTCFFDAKIFSEY